MTDCLEPKIFNFCVANLGNSPAITYNLCLVPRGHNKFEYFESQFSSPRLDQRFLNNNV